jgi:hypothetical protein
VDERGGKMYICVCIVRTLFADQRVVPVVGIVRVAESSMRILEFEKLVAVLARVTRAFESFWQGAVREII